MVDGERGGVNPAAVADVVLMLLADARLPVGANTQSGGLEAALQAGMPAADIPAFTRARLRSVVLVEAATAVVARAMCGVVAEDESAGEGEHERGGAPARTTSPIEVAQRLTRVGLAWDARTIAAPLRDNSRLLARGLSRFAVRMWPEHPAVHALSRVERPNRAVVLGVVAAAGGLTADRLAALVGYDDVQTVAAAALKLLPMDPLDAAGWVLAAASAIAEVAARCAPLTEPEDIPAQAAPQGEAWAMRHAVATARLFRA